MSFHKHAFFKIFAVGAMFAVASFAQQTDWSYHKTLFLNTSATLGANVTATVTRFPVLVRLSAKDSAVFSQSVGRGADLRFSRTDAAAAFPQQIERWDSAGRKAEVWVLVDTVKGNNNTQTIRMHWGKTGAASVSNGAAVFDTAQGYGAVWHLGDNAGPSPDATGNGSATWVNAPLPADGAIGRALNFQNESSTGLDGAFLSAPYANNNFKTSGAAGMTLSAWVNRTGASAAAGPQHIAGRFRYSDALEIQYSLQVLNDEFQLMHGGDGADADNVLDGSASFADGSWYHLAATLVNGEQRLYVNGTVAKTATAGVGALDNEFPGSDFTIAKMDPQNTAYNQYFNGVIDEVRLVKSVRSESWVKLEYENQKAGQTLVHFDSIGSGTGLRHAATRGGRAGISVTPEGRGAVFRIDEPGAAGGKLSVSDLQGRVIWEKNVSSAGTITWNGLTATGTVPARGTYFVRLAPARGAAFRGWEGKLALTR